MERTEGMDVIYFSDDGKNTPKKQFNDLIDSVEPRNAKSGGRNAEGCNITLPDGQLFYAMGYHGDIEGWRKDIEAGAKRLGLFLAHIEGDRFIVSDGRSFALSECTIEFT
ncbi:Uncharacterised protein [Yersinia rohdei]|nr:Uncharacterised protein [Yersinia rohdei]CQJ62354.1 Uncharacterised protein [Yersinia rohdei]